LVNKRFDPFLLVFLFLKPSGYTGKLPFEGKEPGSNGLTLDSKGRLVICEHGDRRISRLEEDGRKITLADRYDGKRFNSPNDLVYRSNGDLYFTDPPSGLPKNFEDPMKELPFQGVYRLSNDGKLTLLTTDIKAPNGIAFSPDEKTLYVTDVDPERPAWLAYDVKEDGTIANGRVFYDATQSRKLNYGGPDGLDVDSDGNLFAARPGGVNVFAPDGTLLGFIETQGYRHRMLPGGMMVPSSISQQIPQSIESNLIQKAPVFKYFFYLL
jgi:gluconolactonase